MLLHCIETQTLLLADVDRFQAFRVRNLNREIGVLKFYHEADVQ